jgi:dihydroorotate dehydrogenase
MAALLTAFRGHTDRPVLVKVPPFSSDAERGAVLGLARRAVEAGAAGLVCANTIPVEEPRLAAGRGGLSGGPLTDLTPRLVEEVAAATGRSVPIVASGGIFTATDAARCLEAGATAVELYTGLIDRGPRVVGELTNGLLAGAAAT